MINAAGAQLITQSEDIRLRAYLCPAGKPTIGRGHTKGITHQMVKDGYTITAEQERELFRQDMEEWERDVLTCLVRKPNENQLAAMISLAFNIGIFAFRTSTVVRAFEGWDDHAAAEAFKLFKKATVNGKKVVMGGLVTRRAREAALFLTPVANSQPLPMPQTVEPERPMSESTIARAGVVAGGTATVAMATEVVNTVSTLRSSLNSLGDWIVPVLLLVTIAAVGYIVWERFNQRDKGIA